MDIAEMRHRVARARVARLATVSTAGEPHLVPVCFTLVDDAVVTAVDRKPKRSSALRRVANVAATGVATLLVDHYSEDWNQLWWVRMDADARVVADPNACRPALRALSEKYPQYERQPPTGPVLVLQVRRWTGWAAAG